MNASESRKQPTLADELQGIVAQIEAAKSELDRCAKTPFGERPKPSATRAGIQGRILALRLSLLYKIEDHWGEVMDGLRESAPPSETGTPKGWKLVPEEPTEPMAAHGQWCQFDTANPPVNDCVHANFLARQIYKAMLAAAPVAPDRQGTAE